MPPVDAAARPLTQHPDRAIRREAQAQTGGDKGGGHALIVVVLGGAALGLYELLKAKPSQPVGAPTPGPVILNPVLPPGYESRPAWFAGSPMDVREAAQMFYALLHRWPDQAGAQAIAHQIDTCPDHDVNCGNRSGIAAGAFFIVAAPQQELLQYIDQQTTKINVSPGNWPGDWVRTAYEWVLWRDPDSGGLAYYASILTTVGGINVLLDLTDSKEFQSDIEAWAAVA